MIVGHLPAGYLAARASVGMGFAALYWGILVGSIAPDLDMIWFYTFDGQQTHHHHFLTHRPALWIAIAALGAILRVKWVLGVGIGGVLHLVLDSIVGEVAWLWPLSDATHPLVIVPATQPHWILSFPLHWTFAVELALVAVALVVFIKKGWRP